MIETVLLLRTDLNAANSYCAFIGTKKWEEPLVFVVTDFYVF